MHSCRSRRAFPGPRRSIGRVLVRILGAGLPIALSVAATGQVASLSPKPPRWGDTVTIVYDPGRPGAKFSKNDALHAMVRIHTDRDVRRVGRAMTRRSGRFELQIPVEEGAAYLSCTFVTAHDWDREAGLSTMIHRPDGQPARGAWQKQGTYFMGPRGYPGAFEKEARLYPDNLAAYRMKWYIANALEPDRAPEIIRKDIAEVGKRAAADLHGWRHSLTVGYLLLGDEERSRETLEQMIAAHPTSALTRSAISTYEYLVSAKKMAGPGPERIAKLKRRLIEQHPGSEIAREASRMLAWKPEVPPELIEAICLPWLKEQPDHPQPYLNLAETYNRHDRDLAKAAEYAETGINLLLEGRLRLLDDHSGTGTAMTLPGAYRTAAALALKLGNPARALGSIRAAQAVAVGARADLHEFEGEIWTAVGDLRRAEKAYVQAWKKGSTTAEESLRVLFERRHGSSEGFEAHLAKARGESSEDEAPLAFPFHVTSLSGRTLDLKSLRGKVVVLNFWYIGCGPCREEIPGLNTLVQHYGERNDVVFIAFANDAAGPLMEFLEKKPFRYEIVPDGKAVALEYGVKFFPTHVIIDRHGHIAATKVGGGEDRDEHLRPIIDRLLKTS